MSAPHIAVVGSVNLDIVARAPKLPLPGETVTDAALARFPGGKGANQALAARRLGAMVSLHAAVGCDAAAAEALRLLRADGVDLAALQHYANVCTGVALIVVDENGENQITVAPGANRLLDAARIDIRGADAVLCQLEIPEGAILAAAKAAPGFFAINCAPAQPIGDAILERADLVIVNEGEAHALGDRLRRLSGLVAITLGAAGAVLTRDGVEIARARPPAVAVKDTTGAGDVFSAALCLALMEKRPPEAALSFACAAAALSTGHAGAQPSFPFRSDVDSLIRN